jgi:hypothetical protein
MEQPTKLQGNCSICNQPVALEIAKTGDSGQAVLGPQTWGRVQSNLRPTRRPNADPQYSPPSQ